MRFRQVEVFHAVYVTGSVSGGARALNVSQPTVSKILRHLEDQLGFVLFDRMKGRLQCTEKGIALFAEIEPLFEKMNDVSRFASRLSKSKTGQLRFAMTPAFGLELGPKAIAKFSKNYPDVTIEVETLHSNMVIDALTNFEIDIGLVFDAPKFPGISAHNIGQTDFVCVAPMAMAWPHKTGLAFADIEKFPLITLNDKSVLGQLLQRKFQDAFVNPVDSRIIVETYYIAKHLVKEGAGIAVIDMVTALSGDVAGLKFRKIDPKIGINVDVVTRLNEPTSRLREAFVQNLREAMTVLDTNIDS